MDSAKFVVFLGFAVVIIISGVLIFKYIPIHPLPKFLPFALSLPVQTPTPQASTGGENFASAEELITLFPTKINLPGNISPAPKPKSTAPSPNNPSNFSAKVEIPDTLINRLIQKALPPDSIVKNPHVTFRGSEIIANFEINSIISGTIEATATISTQNSRVVVDITKASVSGFPLPSFFYDTIENDVNNLINENLDKVPYLKIEKIYVQNSLLVVEGNIPINTVFNY